MHLIKNTYQEIKDKELNKKNKSIFDKSVYSRNQVKQKLENNNKRLYNKFLSTLTVSFILASILIWQVSPTI